MTIQTLYGNSIQPQSFLDGLELWHNDILNPDAPNLLTIPSIQLMNDPAQADYGALKMRISDTPSQIIQSQSIPLAIGQYIEISFEVELISGVNPQARIIAIALDEANNIIDNRVLAAPEFSAIAQNRPFRVHGIVGSGNHDGVDIQISSQARRIIFGIELSAAAEAEILLFDPKIIDVSQAVLNSRSEYINIVDFGAVAGGEDCTAAFLEADAQADGRSIYIPAGEFTIAQPITINAPLRARGKLVLDESTPIMLANNFNFQSYMELFKDEEIALRKAIQALYLFTNHSQLDLCGRRISLSRPIDVAALTGLKKYKTARIIHNGQIEAEVSEAWQSQQSQAQASYSPSAPLELTNVENIETIPIGSLVQGKGVGREVYVIDKDISAQKLTLSNELYDAEPVQSYQFTRFQFLLDYSGFESHFHLSFIEVEWNCENNASAILLPYYGLDAYFEKCNFRFPKDRGICSYHQGCNSMIVRNCSFMGREKSTAPHLRETIGLNAHKNDVKITGCIASYHRHFAVIAGACTLISGNHVYQGANGTQRTAGFVFSNNNVNTIVNGNYIDNTFIEVSNEHQIKENNRGLGGISICNNYFLISDAEAWNRFIKIAPHGQSQNLNRITVNNNVFFASESAPIERVEGIDTTNGSVDASRAKAIYFSENTFFGIGNRTESPATKSFRGQGSLWTLDFSDILPFSGATLAAQSLVAHETLSSTNFPRLGLQKGSNRSQVEVNFGEHATGEITLTVCASSG